MKLEQQVTSLEISKKLKELGVKQESYFWWELQHENVLSTGSVLRVPSKIVDVHYYNGTSPKTDFVSAFTVAELGEMLPEEIEIKEQSYWLETGKAIGNQWVIGYRKNGTRDMYYSNSDDTEANARGKMLIYLLENILLSDLQVKE